MNTEPAMAGLDGLDRKAATAPGLKLPPISAALTGMTLVGIEQTHLEADRIRHNTERFSESQLSDALRAEIDNVMEAKCRSPR